MPPPPEPPAPADGSGGPLARVVVLAGPSGAGKTHLARTTGLPIVALDDFYRDGTHPDLPVVDGFVDWDDPRSWDRDAALAALEALCRTGRVEVPTYRFGEDRAVGRRTLALDGASVVVAEGIFAADLIEPLRERGLLADALLIGNARWLTFWRRLVRDLREGRKPGPVLVRQGWAKTRSEPRVVARLRSLGARPVSRDEAVRTIDRLAGRAPSRVFPKTG